MCHISYVHKVEDFMYYHREQRQVIKFITRPIQYTTGSNITLRRILGSISSHHHSLILIHVFVVIVLQLHQVISL